jgi:hypothetical protein
VRKSSSMRKNRYLFTLGLLILLLSTGTIGCENCPNRRTDLRLAPAVLPSGGEHVIAVSFSGDVFLGSDIERESDARALLTDSSGSILGSWVGRSGQASGALISARVVDVRRLMLKIRTYGLALGVYRLTVIADAAGACRGPWGEAALHLT